MSKFFEDLMNQLDKPKILSDPQIYDIKPPKLKYENTLYAELAEDLKASYQAQLDEIVGTLKKQLELAESEAISAHREARQAKIISIFAIVISVVIGTLQIVLQ